MTEGTAILVFGFMGVAYAASCVWLAVRIFNRRERWAKWTAVGLLIALGLYVLSSGPMETVAFSRHHKITMTTLSDGTQQAQAESVCDLGKWWPIAYAPVMCAMDNGPDWLSDSLQTYIVWWLPQEPE